jgi:hypothetical protein
MRLQFASQRPAAAAGRASGGFLPRHVNRFTFREGKFRAETQSIDWHGYCFESARSVF